jgi:hypothetical protein
MSRAGDLGDPGGTPSASAAGAALRRRRRRLTLAPAADNRFSLLHSLPEVDEVVSAGVETHVAVQVA